MAFTDIFKTKEMKNKIAALEKENISLKKEQLVFTNKIETLNSLLTPEMKNLVIIKDTIDNLKNEQLVTEKEIDSKKEELKQLSNTINELRGNISQAEYIEKIKVDLNKYNSELENKKVTLKDLESQINNLRREIIVDHETIELESFALYKPKYYFTNVEEYKNKLELIRDKQKEMIKNGIAAFGSQTWTVDQSISKGRKMVKDNVKLCLRSFNNECDMAVLSVKFNNYEKCVERIEKSADAIDKLGEILSIRINPDYKRLKIEELSLALEYQIRKQQEKEELRELRAQQREEAKVAKELEEARKKIEKDQKHYENALIQLESKIKNCKSEEELKDLMDKKTELISQMEEVKNKLKDIDYREANQKAGYVYIISNIGSFGEDIYKIGMTRRLDPYERIYELSDASVPFNFDVHAMIFCEDAPKLEAILHKTFESRKLNMINTRREFFKVSLDEIKKVIKENYDKTIEFIDVPDAPQYRESQKIKQGLQS